MRGAVAIVVVSALALAAAPRSVAADSMTASELTKRLHAGAVDLGQVHVTGNVDLDGAIWRHPLICRGCRFDGLEARRAIFESIVDFSGSTFTGPVDMSETTFAAAALFGPETARLDATLATFERGADFSLSTFEDLALFQRATFDRWANFTLTRFRGQAVFALGVAMREAHFERADFLGAADFGVYSFNGDVSFTDATFAGRADFSEAAFVKRARFDRVRFNRGASFQSCRFGNIRPDWTGTVVRPDLRYSFAGLSAGGPLNFAFAGFVDKTDFTNIQVAGPVSFNGDHFNTMCVVLDDASPTGEATSSRCIDINDVSTSELRMSVDAVRTSVDDLDQAPVLATIEAGAKANGDLKLANDAHYELRVLESRRHSAPVRALDYVFYRTIAGYFVRPLNPLLVLLSLVTLMAVLRTMRFRPKEVREASPVPAAPPAVRTADPGRKRLPRGVAARLAAAVRTFGNEALDTLNLIGRQRGEAGPARRIESFFYRLLVVLVLIGFANSNPTLREMFDALR